MRSLASAKPKTSDNDLAARSAGRLTPLSGVRPRFSFAQTFSAVGMIDGPNRRKKREREKDATTMRTPRVRDATSGFWQSPTSSSGLRGSPGSGEIPVMAECLPRVRVYRS